MLHTLNNVMGRCFILRAQADKVGAKNTSGTCNEGYFFVKNSCAMLIMRFSYSHHANSLSFQCGCFWSFASLSLSLPLSRSLSSHASRMSWDTASRVCGVRCLLRSNNSLAPLAACPARCAAPDRRLVRTDSWRGYRPNQSRSLVWKCTTIWSHICVYKHTLTGKRWHVAAPPMVGGRGSRVCKGKASTVYGLAAVTILTTGVLAYSPQDRRLRMTEGNRLIQNNLYK